MSLHAPSPEAPAALAPQWYRARGQKILLLVIVLFLLVGAVGGVWWYKRPPASVFWQGYAEADFVKIGPTQAGLLTAILVSRGDQVASGTLLFTQDEIDDRAASEQASQLLSQAAKQLANLLEGGKPTEIEQAAANLTDAQSTLVRTSADLARGEALLVTGFATKQSVDLLRAEDRSARAKVDALRAALDQSRAPLGRDQEVEAQQAAVAAARAVLAQAEWRLAQRRVSAPTGAVVADVIALPGEAIAAGAPVISLLAPGNIFVRFFVPEAALATLHLGDPLALACTSCPADLSFTLSFISPQAEYTPPLIYSESSKAKLVFLVEARPRPGQAAGLNPGEPVEVRPLQVRGR